METQQKRLYRSKTDRMIAGICGGFAEFFNVDSTIIRLVWTFLVIITGVVPGILLYFIAVFIIPEQA